MIYGGKLLMITASGVRDVESYLVIHSFICLRHASHRIHTKVNNTAIKMNGYGSGDSFCRQV